MNDATTTAFYTALPLSILKLNNNGIHELIADTI